jgi:GTP-binding protein EngB required for normal cell division
MWTSWLLFPAKIRPSNGVWILDLTPITANCRESFRMCRAGTPQYTNEMSTRFHWRLFVAAALSMALALLLLVVLYATDVAFRVWEHLQTAPWWFVAGYGAALLLLLGGGVWLIVRLLTRDRGERPRPSVEVPDEASLQERMQRAETAGVDVAAARQELARLNARREVGEIHVALFGRVSSGKSSVVRALLPDAGAKVSPRAGTTRAVTHYTWTSDAGDRLVVSDLPGLHEPDGSLDTTAREEALRAHVVVYLVDGDLTRDQYTELDELLAFGKPLVLALNKMDLYTDAELAAIRARLLERVAHADRVAVVTVSAATSREVVRLLPDGSEERVERACEPRLEALVQAVQRAIDESPAALERLRDAAVFSLVARHIDAATQGARRQRADKLVTEHTRKAVVGAMAAISPGSDVVIQGYLAVKLVRGLAEIYEVPVREVDVEQFVEQATRRAGGLVPLSLAVVGNALKAFPGLGTLGGGVMHAVAYGLLFESLGRAIVHTLESRGQLVTQPALQSLEESVGENLEARVGRLARLALEYKSGPGRN